MSDYCGDCPYDPRKRTGDDACPFTTLYWDFLARHEERLTGNHRLARPLASMRKLRDLADVRERASTVVRGIARGPHLTVVEGMGGRLTGRSLPQRREATVAPALEPCAPLGHGFDDPGDLVWVKAVGPASPQQVGVVPVVRLTGTQDIETGRYAHGVAGRGHALGQAQPHQADEPIIPAQLATRVAAGTFDGIGEIGVDHALAAGRRRRPRSQRP